MFTPAALKGFVDTLTVQTAGLNAAAAKTLLVQTATTVRDRVLAGTPRPSGYRQVVDGLEGAALTQVRPDGVIVFAWQYLREVVDDTHAALINRSPRDQGDYIAGIIMLVDGAEAGLDAINGDTREVVIVASVPYARRLEVGKRKGGGSFVVQVGPHMVMETATVAKALWGDLANFEFNYFDLSDAYALRQASSRFRRRFVNGVARGLHGNERRHGGSLETNVRYPGIRITPRQA